MTRKSTDSKVLRPYAEGTVSRESIIRAIKIVNLQKEIDKLRVEITPPIRVDGPDADTSMRILNKEN